MKKIYIISGLLLLLSTVNGYSQRIWGNPVGQYTYNPAGASMNDLGEIVTSYYNTYASANNSPRGILLMGSTSFPSDKIGAGFRFNSESGAVTKNTSAEATFVYKIPVGINSKLAFGLSGTYNQIGIDNELVQAKDPNDPFLTQGAESGYWFDSNFGISLNEANQYYIGAAIYNMLGTQTNWQLQDFTNRSSRLISLSGMYSFNLFQGDGKLETSGATMFYVPEDKYTMTYDLNARLIVKKSFWVGTGYTNNMVKALFGFYIQNLSIGYAGGFGLGDIASYTYSMPKHELFLRLELNTSKSSRTNVSR
jgi:type IX secretion system PorP/SprF family membrane protein